MTERVLVTMVRDRGEWRRMRAGDYEAKPFRAPDDFVQVMVPKPTPLRYDPDHDLRSMGAEALEEQEEAWERNLKETRLSARPPYPAARCMKRLALIRELLSSL